MTETMTLAAACDRLAREASWHIRIRQALIDSQHDRARHLIVSRMRGTMDGFAEGDFEFWGNDEISAACEAIDSCAGPLVFRAMREAAHRELDRIISELGYPLEKDSR